MTDLLISLIKIKDRYLLVTHAASATTRPGRNCQDGGVREIRIGPAVGPCGPMRQPDIAGSWRTLNRPRQHSRRLAGNTDTR